MCAFPTSLTYLSSIFPQQFQEEIMQKRKTLSYFSFSSSNLRYLCRCTQPLTCRCTVVAALVCLFTWTALRAIMPRTWHCIRRAAFFILVYLGTEVHKRPFCGHIPFSSTQRFFKQFPQKLFYWCCSLPN